MIGRNVKTNFSAKSVKPVIDKTTYVHPLAAVIGNVTLGKHIMVSPTASIRGDEGQPFYIGDDSNVQDGVVIHALETETDGRPVEKNLYEIKGKQYAVYVGSRVSLAHQSQVHGPAVVLDDTFVGMKALVFRSFVGEGCVIEPGAMVIGVKVPPSRYVPAGAVVNNQEQADKLPRVTEDYPMKNMNKGVIHVNTGLAKAYLSAEKKKK
ncbi:MAG: carbonic anhydrase [Thermodesulfobacteriota bacterium]